MTIADLNKPDKFHNREAEGIVDWLTKKSGPQWTEVNSKVKAKQTTKLRKTEVVYEKHMFRLSWRSL